MLSKTTLQAVIAFSLALTIGIWNQQTFGQNSPLKIRRADDVAANWNPSQHIYVKDDIGVSPNRLADLESWIHKNAPNWTVVLMQDAESEDYSAPDGRRFEGPEAVRYLISHELNNQTGFGTLVDSRTGEKNGAIFILFLKERKFAYFGSDVHDRRNLGESKWRNSLDREAVRAMRSGGRVVDAVRNSIKLIESRLSSQIRKEESAVKQAKDKEARKAAERSRTIETLKSDIVHSEGLLKRLEESASKLKSEFPRAIDSALATPPIEKWRARYTAQTGLLAEPNVDARKTRLEIKKIDDEVNRYLDSFAAHSAFEEMVEPVERRLDEIADDPSGAAAETSREAYRLLDEARDGHALGKLDFAASIHQASGLVEQGKKEIKIEEQRIISEREKKSLVRKTMMTIGSIIGAMFLGLLGLLNFRRRPALKRAHALFDKRSKSVENELEQVDEIVARGEQVVGTRESFSEKRFAGDTLKLGQATHQSLDQLKGMATEANRVLANAESLIHPANPLAEAANMFSSARYEHCVNELSGSSLQIPARDENGNPGKPVWVSFNEFFAALHDQKDNANASLETFKNSVKGVNEKVDALQLKIDEANQIEKQLADASRRDRYFRIPSLFEKLIPSAQSDCDRAESNASTDPIKAVKSDIRSGMQKIDDGLTIIRGIQDARENVFPVLDHSGDELKKLGFRNRWIENRVDELGKQAEQLIVEATSQSVAEKAAEFANEVAGLGHRATRSLELGQQLRDQIEPAADELQKRIEQSRNEVASSLGIPLSSALRENQYDPDVEMREARQQIQSARSAINFGGIDSATEAIEEFAIDSNQATSLIERSLEALNEFEPNYSAQMAKFQELKQSLAQTEESIQSTKARFADSALSLQDDSFVDQYQVISDDQSPTVSSVFANCATMLSGVESDMGLADSDYQKGEILSAANSLELIKGDLANVELMTSAIASHCEKVERVASTNTSLLQQRITHFESLLKDVQDDRTQAQTAKSYDGLEDQIKKIQTEFDTPSLQRDPFADLNLIDEVEDKINSLAGELQADRHAYEVASQSVVAAENELGVAQSLVSKSLNDRIADSVMVKNCQSEIERLDNELGRVKKSLKVPHQNWSTVNVEATTINNKLGVVGGTLRKELQHAQQAVEYLSQASTDVYEAANWRGSYGVVVDGRPGVEELETARQLLGRGNYHRSIEFSRAATHLAESAIESAKRTVARKRRKLAREARERRRQGDSGIQFGALRSNQSSSSIRNASWSSGITNRSNISRSSIKPKRNTRSSSSSTDSNSVDDSGFGVSGW